VDTLQTAEVFPYHCTVHPAMVATITVAAGSPMTQAISITDFAFTPNNVTVGVGAIVTWTNNGANPHTVTSD
jgi:plastocyanin